MSEEHPVEFREYLKPLYAFGDCVRVRCTSECFIVEEVRIGKIDTTEKRPQDGVYYREPNGEYKSEENIILVCRRAERRDHHY